MASAVPQALSDDASAAAAAAAAAPLQFKSATEANSYLFGLIMERLASLAAVRPEELSVYCYLLARAIDNSLTKNNVPSLARALPSLVKQVYQHRNNPSLQSAIVVLMMTVKNACTVGWFDPVDTKELLGMTSELCSSFCTSESAIIEESNVVNIVAKVISRFYPQLMLRRLLVSFEAKSGYDVLMNDFHIPKNLPPEEAIRLFVVQTDNLETSACIVSPPQVSFLVNGKGVDRRTNFSLDTGPQFPTDITKMLKCGINIIQAVGYFSGTYIIAVAYMSKITSYNAPILNDYVQPSLPELVLDSDIIEGASRVSLKCPISFGRIKTPVKGHICNHRQCFDYDNYMEINLRKPSWRCPICNQPVSCMDIRIDQSVMKILSEEGMDIADVDIFADGSWKVAVEQHRSGTPTGHSNDFKESESNRTVNAPSDVMDLTMEGNGESSVEQNEDAVAEISSIQVESLNFYTNKIDNNNCEIEDRKPSLCIQDLPSSEAPHEPTFTDCSTITQADSYHIVGESSSINLPDFRMFGTLESLIPNAVLNPGVGRVADALYPVLNGQSMSSLANSQPGLCNQHRTQVCQPSENMLLRRPESENAIIHSETERRLIPTHVNRAPIVSHALLGQAQISSLPQSTRTLCSRTFTSNGSPSISRESISSMTPPNVLRTLNSDTNMQQPSRNLRIASTVLHHPTMSQFMGLTASNLLCTRAPSDQHRVADTYRAQVQSATGLQYRHHQQMNLGTHQNLTGSSHVPSVRFQHASQGVVGIATGSLVNNSNHHLAAQQAAYAASLQAGEFQTRGLRNLPSFPLTSNDSSLSNSEQLQNIVDGSLAVGSSDGFPQLLAEESWQPTGRMRGSLTGSAYSAALSHYLARQAQRLPPRPSVVSSVGDASSGKLSAYGSSSIHIHGTQASRQG